MNRTLIAVGVLSLATFFGCAHMRTAVHANWLDHPKAAIAVLPFAGDEPFNDDLGEGRSEWVVDNVHLRWVSVENGQIMASTRYQNNRGGNIRTIAKRIVRSLDTRIQKLARLEQKERGAI
jgi:hypothetical protein